MMNDFILGAIIGFIVGAGVILLAWYDLFRDDE